MREGSLASAMRCVSSFFLIAVPRLLAASINSAANFSSIDFSARPRAASMSQRMLSDKPPLRPHLDRHLIGGAADAPRTDLDGGPGVLDGALEDAQGVFLGFRRDDIERAIEDRFRHALLALIHDRVDKLRHHLVAILGVRQNLPLSNFTFARHNILLRSLGAVLGAALAAVLNADRIQRAAHDVITHAGQILDAAAADQNHRVLLQVVPDAGNVGGHLDAVGRAARGPLCAAPSSASSASKCRRACTRRASAGSFAAPARCSCAVACSRLSRTN